ncbi:MAG TPA: DNA polymerase III subunit gamma/tau [Ktedonobacteraceae bacterium]
MASQSLYRKWRSQTFDEMIGQELIIRTLKNALQNNKLSHAYLFTGPRGTGKTTTARLLAKTVNCTNSRNGEPCNECQQCREITAGTSFNVIEIDAASNRGIDNIRELREKVMVPPATGKYKIYILDEAHMLTTEAFNALLKTLEEPPDYAIFVMATTDVHKMLPTVLSRCQRFDFKRFTTRQIAEHVLHVAREEQVEIERSAVELLARTAAGGMRDALSLLDQAIAYSGNSISLAQIQSMLGVADARSIWNLLTHIATLDSPALLYLVHELSEAGADLRQINTQVIDYWRALMLAKAGADVAVIMDLTADELDEVNRLIPSFTLEELTECARIFAQNELMQKNQGTPQLGLELAALESIELHRKVQSGQSVKLAVSSPPTAERVVTPAARLASHASAAPVALTTPGVPPTPRPAQPSHEELPSASASPNPLQATSKELSAASPVRPPLVSEQADQAPAVTVQGLSLRQIQGSWDSVKLRTRQKSSLLATYIGMCDVLGVEVEEEHTVIVIRAAKSGHFTFIRGENRPKEIEWALGLEFGQPCKLRVLAPGQAYEGKQAEGSASYSLVAVASPPSAFRDPAAQLLPRAAAPRPSTAPVSQPSTFSEELEPYRVTSKPPLAIPQGVRENKRVALSKEELGQKVRDDPVVQEVIKTFGAIIGEIQPK